MNTDEQVADSFERVIQEADAIDILVNNVCDRRLWQWDALFEAGGRAHYYASQLAARSMVAYRRGLIVNNSFWAAHKHIGNVAYGASKAATDKMTGDMAIELWPCGVTILSLYPELVMTEKVMQPAAWHDGRHRTCR